MDKLKIHYVCGNIGEPKKGQAWGGTMATNYIIKKAMAKSDKYELVMRCRTEFQTPEQIQAFLDEGDLGWVDETSILQTMFAAGLDRPDLIGPISRSPIKRYNNGTWESVYDSDWFYSGPVLRLNENEEKEIARKPEVDKKTDWIGKVTFIRHGIDSELLKPSKKKKKYVLWAGNAARPAKNYQLFKDIKEVIRMNGGLPLGYEFREMSGYTIDKYWEVLDETRVCVCTSLYESFCCAANEARAKGVPTIVRDFLTGSIMYTDQPIQVEYNPIAFAKKIKELCVNDSLYESEAKRARKWVEKNCTMDVMRKDLEKAFDKIIKSKKKE